MQTLPPSIPGSKSTLSEDFAVSVLIDRNLLLEVGKAVLVILSTDEAAALYRYLQKHRAKFGSPKGEQL